MKMRGRRTLVWSCENQKKYKGNNVAKEGCVSILHMRNFQRDKKLGDDLVQDILSR